MKKNAIVSCNKWINKIQEDLLLKQYLENEGYNAQIISWEDSKINYNDYSGLILRSVWGYQNKYFEFKTWLSMIKSMGIPLFNNVDIILDNIKKDKQFEILYKHNIPYIDTKFIFDVNELNCYFNSNLPKVIKPIISGSGSNTFIIKSKENINQIKEIYKKLLEEKDNGIILQPFISEIKDGEFACIYIDGINTHNMLRFPGILSVKHKPIFLNEIPASVSNLAQKVSTLEEYKDYLYMRIDIVLKNNEPLIMEVELAEPDLLFKYIPDEEIKNNKMEFFAKKLVRRLKK